MAAIEQVFWGWDAPLLHHAVMWLDGRAHDGKALDLSDTLIVVPTAESSRRLREALAADAAKRGAAVMAPYVWHPEQCLRPPEDRDQTATESQALIAWIAVLQKTDLSALKSLLPRVPDSLSAPWISSLAANLIDLQTLLGAAGLDFAAVAVSEHARMDRDRWEDLARLEDAFRKVLATGGLMDAHRLKARRAAEPLLPAEVKRAVVIGVPDPPPLFCRWLERVSKNVTVTVCVQAPPSIASAFTKLGVPVRSSWDEDAPICIALAEDHLHLEADSAAQARKATSLLASLAPLGRVAVGVCDAETIARMEDQLALEQARTYEPGGTPAGQHGFLHFARTWRELVATRSWAAFASLLRTPDFSSCWWKPIPLLKSADEFSAERLPVTLDSAAALLARTDAESDRTRKFNGLRKAMDGTLALVGQFSQNPLPQALRALLSRLYGQRTFVPTDPLDHETMSLATAWLQIADALQEDARRFGVALDGSEALRLSIDQLAEEQLIDPRGEPDLVLQGWLELLWEPAPHLIVLGCNEENLPGIFISHPFLPDSLREKLGLPCQAARYCRDAYLLIAMAEQRKANGALHLLCGQWSEDGDALHPSRLLFLCADQELAARVAHLFPRKGSPAGAAQQARTLAWKLQPRAAPDPKPDTISASRLRAYLTCPFRYYLSHHLGMEAIEPHPGEMSAADFGNLIHLAFKALASEPGMRDCTDPKKIAVFLCDSARDEVCRLYGTRLPFPVRLQLDSALQRLAAAADVEAAHRKAGWRTLHAEFDIGHESDPRPLLIGSRRLCGKIDRIDRGPDGAILILDLKTSDAGEKPNLAHLKSLNARTVADTDEWLIHQDSAGKCWRWIDLQLPLYARAWQEAHPGPVQAGYFQLPTSVQSTAISLWEELDKAALDSAMQCAREAVRRIDAHQFWPPSDSVRYDAFEALFAGYSPEAIVDPSAFTADLRS